LSFRGFPSDTVGCMTIPHTQCCDDGTYNAILVGNTSDHSQFGFTENDGYNIYIYYIYIIYIYYIYTQNGNHTVGKTNSEPHTLRVTSGNHF
jgi:hypothetical protein